MKTPGTGDANEVGLTYRDLPQNVRSGDTLWKIAKRHNTDVYSVKKINGLRSDSIYIGQVLRLPSSR